MLWLLALVWFGLGWLIFLTEPIQLDSQNSHPICLENFGQPNQTKAIIFGLV